MIFGTPFPSIFRMCVITLYRVYLFETKQDECTINWQSDLKYFFTTFYLLHQVRRIAYDSEIPCQVVFHAPFLLFIIGGEFCVFSNYNFA